MRPHLSFAVAALTLVSFSQTSSAGDPKFASAAGEEPPKESEEKGALWKAQAQAGLVMTTGNSSTTRE